MIKCKFENGNNSSLRHVVIDTLVLRDEKILLVKRNKDLLEGGKWALVGGYVERDETLTQAVEREVFEETGWKIKEIKLLRIVDSPNRRNEDRQNISFVYTCLALEKKGKADWESDRQQWFPIHSLPPDEQIAFDHLDSVVYYKEQI